MREMEREKKLRKRDGAECEKAGCEGDCRRCGGILSFVLSVEKKKEALKEEFFLAFMKKFGKSLSDPLLVN